MTYLFAVLFFVVSIIARSIPHIPNMAPIGALALWSGAYLPKRWGWMLPIAAMFLSDWAQGFYSWKLMVVVYGSFALYSFIGWSLRVRQDPLRFVTATIGASTAFFLVTNFAVWSFSNWYPHSTSGLLWAYTLGLPFFRNTLLGDLGYTVLLFGAYQFVVTHSSVARISYSHVLKNSRVEVVS